MRRRLAFGVVLFSSIVFATADGFVAMHGPGNSISNSPSSGFPWHGVLIWAAIGVVIAFVLTRLVLEGRRHHWHLPHRPVHA